MTKKIIFILLILTTTFVWGVIVPFAEAISLPSIQLGVDDVEDPEKVSSALQILFSADDSDSGPINSYFDHFICADHNCPFISPAGDGHTANSADADFDWS